MQKKLWLAVGLCLLSACRERATTRDSDSIGSPATSSMQSADASHSAASLGADASGGSAASGTSVKSELVDHAQMLERIAQAKGRIVVVDVWSTSCLPCMKEFPHLVELARRWPEDLVCISLNVDYLGLPKSPASTYVAKVEEFLTAQHAQADNLLHLVSSEPDSDVLSKLKVESMPGILVFNRQGEQVAKLTTDSAGSDGLTYAGDVVPLVEKLIEEK